jgi:class 3 adenylate cyclase
VLVSHAVREQVRDGLALAFEDLGERELKNLARPVRVSEARWMIARLADVVPDLSAAAVEETSL